LSLTVVFYDFHNILWRYIFTLIIKLLCLFLYDINNAWTDLIY